MLVGTGRKPARDVMPGEWVRLHVHLSPPLGCIDGWLQVSARIHLENQGPFGTTILYVEGGYIEMPAIAMPETAREEPD